MADEKAAVEAQGAVTEKTKEISEFEQFLEKDIKASGTRDAVRAEVQTLAEWALKYTTVVSEDALRSIEAIKAQIDRMLTEQVNEIIHHAEFQKLEGAWRGLRHLVSNTETDEKLKLKVMNISKKELGKTLEKFTGTAWDQSPIFKEVYNTGYGVLGGEPYGCLVGDYHFDHSPQDVALLGEMAKVSAASHAPFITGAAPSLFGFGSWQELSNPRALAKIQSTPEHASWRSLRESEDSRYLGLAMPRFLSRLPYGAKTSPVDEFAFEEDTASASHEKYTWANSAYAMAVNINRSFKETGWCSQIRGVENGGGVEGLPVHTFPTDDGGVDMKCPTEIAIDDRREKELADLGMMPVLHRKNSDVAVFIAAQSLQKPTEYQDPVATSNSRLSANLPYLFATCRFAHYLKVMVRDKIGSYKERSDMETWLNNWIMQYVLANPAGKTDIEKARRPLKEARVVVEEVEGNPGFYNSTFYLLPHYQLEGLTVSLRLVSQMPSGKK